ncbi:transcriptional regulator opi1 [Vermiconidia calcicola]|uniref:Transcriptional regulator opi1 n=1 Tax=Vermiconidia calcicola TaxID=1690605 RepID=A0ACC3NG34_9PEZI|nr:transcriptional regulator opi1 [Vermiconidia calcicola]
MEQEHTSPPAYISHDPAHLNFPSVPRGDVRREHAIAEITLPDLKTVLSPEFQDASRTCDSGRAYLGHDSPNSMRSLPRMDPGPSYTNGERTSLESTMKSPSEAGSVMSIDERGLRSTSVSMEDENVRNAAEALAGLGNPDFIRSPSSRTFSHASPSSSEHTPAGDPQHEPLLELFTKAHPWVGGTINGSLSAYSSTKNYSPRLVQYGANLVERSTILPVVSTVSSVGRMTGVESGLRWYYGGNVRRPIDVEQGEDDPTSKRRRIYEVDLENGDANGLHQFNRDSQDFGAEALPAYRASKPPSYRSEVSPMSTDRQTQLEQRGERQSWSSQVFVMTSGLSVALSETSRHSLRQCLSFLSRQAEHVTVVMSALQLVLDQYDQARDAWHRDHDSTTEKGQRPKTPEQDEAARRLAGVIDKHSKDIWRTLQNVVDSISHYAGAALPDNAKEFVKNQLLSLPQRWRFVSNNQTGESETSRSAHRMVAFATEGLDMMSQVSQTMKLTLESAERWLERVGRRQEAARESNGCEMMDGSPNSQHARDIEKQ